MKDNIIITIDGPAASGKSTTARRLARILNFRYLDTGAIYRAVTLKAQRQKVDMMSEKDLSHMLDSTKIKLENTASGIRVWLDGVDATQEIRQPSVTKDVSSIAKYPEVRRKVIPIQREFAFGGSTVCEGRDMATVVFPGADAKFYLDATLTERAKRRYKELLNFGESVGLEQIKEDIKRRDASDTHRPTAPLKKAEDAIYIDTTGMTIDKVVEALSSNIKKCIGN